MNNLSKLLIHQYKDLSLKGPTTSIKSQEIKNKSIPLAWKFLNSASKLYQLSWHCVIGALKNFHSYFVKTFLIIPTCRWNGSFFVGAINDFRSDGTVDAVAVPFVASIILFMQLQPVKQKRRDKLTNEGKHSSTYTYVRVFSKI